MTLSLPECGARLIITHRKKVVVDELRGGKFHGGGSMRAFTYDAGLGFYSKTLHLSRMTKLLGQPTKGIDRAGMGSRLKASWLWNSPLASDAKLEDHIELLLDFAEQRKEAVALVLASEETWGRIFCGLSVWGKTPEGPLGVTLSPQMIKRLVRLNLQLGLDPLC